MRTAAIASVCCVLALITPSAQTEQSVPVLETESTDNWFVELASAPTVDGTDQATLEREEASFHAAAARAGARYTEKRHFRTLWNGLSIHASSRDATRLRTVPGVQAVY